MANTLVGNIRANVNTLYKTDTGWPTRLNKVPPGMTTLWIGPDAKPGIGTDITVAQVGDILLKTPAGPLPVAPPPVVTPLAVQALLGTGPTILDVPWIYPGGDFPAFFHIPSASAISDPDLVGAVTGLDPQTIRMDAERTSLADQTFASFDVGSNPDFNTGEMWEVPGPGRGILLELDYSNVPSDHWDFFAVADQYVDDAGNQRFVGVRLEPAYLMNYPGHGDDGYLLQLEWAADDLYNEADDPDGIYYNGFLSLPYDPVAHRWLKIVSEDDGTWTLYAGPTKDAMTVPTGYLNNSEFTDASGGTPIYLPTRTPRAINLTAFRGSVGFWPPSGVEETTTGYALLPYFEILGAEAPPPEPEPGDYQWFYADPDLTWHPIGGTGGGSGGANEVIVAREPAPTAEELELWVDLDASSPTGTSYAWVTVIDPATDPRPAVDHVMWVGGTSQPVSMTSADLWVKAASGG